MAVNNSYIGPVSNICDVALATLRFPITGANMFEVSRPTFVWLIWRYLSFSEVLFFLALCALGVYSLFLAVAVVRFQNVAGDLNHMASVHKGRLRLRKRVRNLQQATVAAFFLFGFVLSLCFQSAYTVLGDSPTPTGWIVLRNFYVHFAFAANAFFVLLVVHIIQWFVANRVNALGLHPNP
jgi:hypothetical protein